MELEHCGVYKLKARNLSVGIYNAEKDFFVGIRNKFNTEFLDTEWNLRYVNGVAYTGTAKAIELLDLAGEYEPIDGWWLETAKITEDGYETKWQPNTDLFSYLRQYS